MKKTILTSLLLFAISICNANQSFLTKEGEGDNSISGLKNNFVA